MNKKTSLAIKQKKQEDKYQDYERTRPNIQVLLKKNLNKDVESAEPPWGEPCWKDMLSFKVFCGLVKTQPLYLLF